VLVPRFEHVIVLNITPLPTTCTGSVSFRLSTTTHLINLIFVSGPIKVTYPLPRSLPHYFHVHTPVIPRPCHETRKNAYPARRGDAVKSGDQVGTRLPSSSEHARAFKLWVFGKQFVSSLELFASLIIQKSPLND